MTIIRDDADKLQKEVRYWNCGSAQISIVASVTRFHGEPFDWAAYIGADTLQTEEACVQETLKHGCKLSEKDARHYFPEFKDIPYRG